MNLQTIDNFTRRLGPVSALIDVVMEEVLPKRVASADCGNCGSITEPGNICYRYCDGCHQGAQQYAVYHTWGGRWNFETSKCDKCDYWGCITTQPDGQCQPGTPC
jgi:hypothetical protein